MSAVVKRGMCEHCGGEFEPLGRWKAAGWGCPEVWGYQCVRCGSLYFSEPDPNDVPLIPELELKNVARRSPYTCRSLDPDLRERSGGVGCTISEKS